MPAKQTNKREAQGAETKRKIYEVAERLFARRDFADVSVKDITDGVGITKGAFYVHFRSKDELISLLLRDYVARTDTDYKAFLATLPADLPSTQALLALVTKIADVLAGTIGCENMQKVYQMLLAGTASTEAVKSYNREIYGLFHSILERGIQRGELRSSQTAAALSRHLLIAFRGITFEWCIRYPEYDLKEQAREHFQLLLQGILAD